MYTCQSWERRHPCLLGIVLEEAGRDDWIARQTPGGFQGVIAEIESLAPKVVPISRLAKVAHRAELEQWVEQHYDKLDLRADGDVYVRRRS